MESKELAQRLSRAKEVWVNPEENERQKLEQYEEVCSRAMRLFPCGLDEYKMLRDGRFREVHTLPPGSVAITRLSEWLPFPEDSGLEDLKAKVWFEHIFKGEKTYEDKFIPLGNNIAIPSQPKFSKFQDTGKIKSIRIEFSAQKNHSGPRRMIAVSEAQLEPIKAVGLEQLEDINSSLAIVEEAMAAPSKAKD